MVLALFMIAALPGAAQDAGQEDRILERGEKLLEGAKAAYEDARTKSSVAAFVDAGFKLEEARIKFIVLQEIGSPERQKFAGDRLRAINQLGKLIHDGKVAISGSPAEAPASKPADAAAAPAIPEPAPDAAPARPEAAPAKSPMDVMARLPVPTADKLREPEKIIKDLFKEAYAKKAPADRQALARALMAQAEKTSQDPSAQWVLYREAQDVAAQVCDVRLSMAAIDAAARVFDVDPMPMKAAALAAAVKVAKIPVEIISLAEAQLKLADEWVLTDQYDAADKAVVAALASARRVSDQALILRATNRTREVAEMKTRYQAMKTVLQVLAKTPDDPAANNEMGQFHCFVKGNWDLGVRFLVKGSDATLKTLALKEMAPPLTAIEAVSIADGWWDLAAAEKSTLRKSQMQAHAFSLYEGAAETATGLVAAKIEKRLAEREATGGPAGDVNLIPLIDVKQDTIAGEWQVQGGKLICDAAVQFARIQIPYTPPDEYDLSAVITRTENSDSLEFGLVRGSSQFQAAFDSFGGTMAGIALLDGKWVKDNDSLYRGVLFKHNQPSKVVCSVRKDGVKLTVDGKMILDWKGQYSRLTNDVNWSVPDPKALYVGCWATKYVISKLVITPVSGKGRKLR